MSESSYTESIYLIYADASSNSNKFWQATVNSDGSLHTSWGRVGYKGQAKVYKCASYSKALSQLRNLAAAKKQKGYRESQQESQFLEPLQIQRAIHLLNGIKNHVRQRSFNNSDYLELLNKYLTIIPTPLGMNINPATIYRSIADVERQHQILQQLLSSENQISEATKLASSPISKTTSLKSISDLFWKF